jgi:hypothetical protein
MAGFTTYHPQLAEQPESKIAAATIANKFFMSVPSAVQ